MVHGQWAMDHSFMPHQVQLYKKQVHLYGWKGIPNQRIGTALLSTVNLLRATINAYGVMSARPP